MLSSCGFKSNAHNAGLSVRALIAESTIEIASVRPNCL